MDKRQKITNLLDRIIQPTHVAHVTHQDQETRAQSWGMIAATAGDAAVMIANIRKLAKLRQPVYINSVPAFFSQWIKCEKSGVWGPMLMEDTLCSHPLSNHPTKCPTGKFFSIELSFQHPNFPLLDWAKLHFTGTST